MRPVRRSLTAAAALSMLGVDVAAVVAVVPTVDPARVRIVPASQLFRRFWAKGIVAVTMPWAVYVTPAVLHRITSSDDRHGLARLVVHELVHLHQYRTAGPLRHIGRYVADYLRGRRGGLGHWDAYLGIEAEVEARRLAAEFADSQGPR